MLRHAKRIEVGPYQDKVALSVVYEGGERRNILFSAGSALKAADLMARVASGLAVTIAGEDVEVMMAEQVPKKPDRGHREDIGLSEHVNVGLTGGNNETDKSKLN